MLAFEAQPVLMVPTSPRCLRYFEKRYVEVRGAWYGIELVELL